MQAKKRGVYFTIDAILAAGILITAIVLISKTYVSEPSKEQAAFISEDTISVFTNLKISEIDNDYVKSLIEVGTIENTNKTLLEQIGELWAEDNMALAQSLAKNITENLIPKRFGVGIYIDGEEIYSRSKPIGRSLISSRKIISGIEKEKPTSGFVSKVVLSGIKSKVTSSYAYFGGLEGEGNLTKRLMLSDNVIFINGSYIEVSAGGDFNLYINGIFSGKYNKTSSNDKKADNWNLSNTYFANFRPGENNITINFANGSSYIAGGFISVTYETSSTNDTQTFDYERNWLPGIDGAINLYSSFYAPPNLTNMSIFLHFLSQYQTYFTIGNKTIFESNGSIYDQEIFLDDATLSALLDYDLLEEKTIPIRMGFREADYSFESKLSAVLITDRTGTMNNCDVDATCSPGLCDSSSPCHEKRIEAARESDKAFIDTILSSKNNEVGLASFGRYSNPSCDFHDMSNDNVSLKTRVDDYNDEWCSGTCLSCGVFSATQLLIEDEALSGLKETTDINTNRYYLGDSNIDITTDLNIEVNQSKLVKSRLSILGREIREDDIDDNVRDCIFFNNRYLGRVCDSGDMFWRTCSYPIKPEWFKAGDPSYGTWMQTTQADFESGTLENVNSTISPGEVYLENNFPFISTKFYDNFDDNNPSEYSSINGNWRTALEPGKGFVLNETDNAHTIIYGPLLNFKDNYTIEAVMFNGDDRAAGVAFRVNTQDADNFYSCSASSSSDFDGGVWRHDNDLVLTPTVKLAGVPWNYVENRWYNITIIVNESSNTIRCIWKSAEAGAELDVIATDDDIREEGSIGFWASSQDRFKADLLSVKKEVNDDVGYVLSRVFDAGSEVMLDSINWTEILPLNTNITLNARSGYTPNPDASWDNFDWSGIEYDNSAGSKIEKSGRYVQWRATLSSKDSDLFIPILRDVTINYTTYFGKNNVTITAGTSNGCYDIPGDNDEWEVKDIKLTAWEAESPVILTSDFDSSQYNLDDGQEIITLLMDTSLDQQKMRAATLEFEALDVDHTSFDCVYVNDFYLGAINFQRWNGTNNAWQKILLDIPVVWLKNGENRINFTSGVSGGSGGCLKTSGNNDDWSLRNINLTVAWLDKKREYNRARSMLIMSDGDTYIAIDGSNPSAWAEPEVIQKACEAFNLYGIGIYAVAFGSDMSSRDMLNQSACCDDCSHFYTSNNADQLVEIYKQIAQDMMVNITFEAQEINISGEPKPSKLYADSYIDLNYTPINQWFGKIPLTFQTERFENNITQGFLTVPEGVTVADAKVTSYSGKAWTDNLTINDNRVYKLSDYNDNYINLGDPFIVSVPEGYLSSGVNDIIVSAGVGPENYSGGSEDNRIIYNLLLNAFSNFTPVVAKSEGCNWEVEFEDSTSATIAIPETYTGADTCNYENGIYEADDSLDIAVYGLLSNLDLDKDGLLDVKVSDENFDIEDLTITKVPSLWGPAIVEVRVWE